MKSSKKSRTWKREAKIVLGTERTGHVAGMSKWALMLNDVEENGRFCREE